MISAPHESEQSSCYWLGPALEQMIGMEKAEGLLCSLAHNWHVLCFALLFSGLLFNTNSSSTAMQIAVAKCASINIS